MELKSIEVAPGGPVEGEATPPGSKSITNRAVACAALAEGTSRLTGLLDSEDTRLMADAVARLGFAPEFDWAACSATIVGRGGKIPAESADLFVGNSGTTVRFLAAMLAAGRGKYRLDGTKRMRERPIQDLLDAVNALGGHAVSLAGTGCPPLEIDASGLRGGQVRIRGDVSSQFLSGLLLAAPAAQSPLEVIVDGELVSKPYVDMTLEVMRRFGARFEVVRDPDGGVRSVTVENRPYHAENYPIEPDASAASYFFAAAAVTGGRVAVPGLSRSSLQGDVKFVELLERMGCGVTWEADRIVVRGGRLRGVDCDMNAVSDTVMTLGVVALFAEGKTTIRGVPHIRHKETDRIAALACELRKVGASVVEFADGLEITPPAGPLHGAEIDTYLDHRMAMSLALVGLVVPGIVIRDPGCTAKTYPRFFEDLETLVGRKFTRVAA